MRSDRHSRGLTLVELLVAIAVLAIISVLGWRGLDVITRTRLITQSMPTRWQVQDPC